MFGNFDGKVPKPSAIKEQESEAEIKWMLSNDFENVYSQVERRLELFTDMALGALLRGYPLHMQEFIEHAKKCLRQIGDGKSERVARSLCKLSRLFVFNGDKETGKIYHNRCADMCKKLNFNVSLLQHFRINLSD